MCELTSVGYTKDEWLSMFNEYKPKFGWFIIEWFGETAMDRLNELAKQEQRGYCPVERMISLLNQVWFELPDRRFNIMVNPPGWSEFLRLIEPL